MYSTQSGPNIMSHVVVYTQMTVVYCTYYQFNANSYSQMFPFRKIVIVVMENQSVVTTLNFKQLAKTANDLLSKLAKTSMSASICLQFSLQLNQLFSVARFKNCSISYPRSQNIMHNSQLSKVSSYHVQYVMLG